jgi:protein-disulfide isomerase-like protein with CxxC motif
MMLGLDGRAIDVYAPDARNKLPLINVAVNIGDEHKPVGNITAAEHIRHIEGMRESLTGSPHDRSLDRAMQEWETGIDGNTGKPFGPEMFAEALRARNKLESDPAFLQRFHAGALTFRDKQILAAINGVLIHEPRTH